MRINIGLRTPYIVYSAQCDQRLMGPRGYSDQNLEVPKHLGLILPFIRIGAPLSRIARDTLLPFFGKFSVFPNRNTAAAVFCAPCVSSRLPESGFQ